MERLILYLNKHIELKFKQKKVHDVYKIKRFALLKIKKRRLTKTIIEMMSKLLSEAMSEVNQDLK